jgi:hypothetical protein
MTKLIILLLFLSQCTLYSHPGEATQTPDYSFSDQPILSASDPTKRKFNNNIYAGASIGLIYGSLSINYERRICSIGKRGTSFYLRSAFGKWEVWGGSGKGGILSAIMVFSARPSHLEAGLGCSIINEKTGNNYELPPDKRVPVKSEINLLPNINVGYRYQHPSRHFFFRSGASFPEGGYMGIGIHF